MYFLYAIMPGEQPRRKELVSSLSDQSRRSVIKGLAGFAAFTGTSTVAAGSEVPSATKTDAVFEEHAGDVLGELSAAGVLSEASASDLRTDKPVEGATDAGVGRVEKDGKEVYAVRQQTDEGSMAVFVAPETGESFALVNTGSEVERFGDDVAADGACDCGSAWHCVRGEMVCYGVPAGFCCP